MIPSSHIKEPERGWSRLAGGVETDLADIDAEIDELALHEPIAEFRRSAEDDQAAGLRRMIGSTAPTLIPGIARTARPRFAPPTPDRLAILRAASRARVIAIASGKGGVGKTNIAVNTAIALAARGLRTTLLDADLGTANADVLCGITPSARIDHVLAPGGLAHQDAAARKLSDIAVNAPGGFRLVPGSAGIGRMADLTAGERRWLVSALVELAADTDVLLIDAAAGVGQGVTSLLHAADLAIVVTTPEPTAIADAYALIKCLVMEGMDRGDADGADPLADRIALVVNQVSAPVDAFATHARIAAVCDRFLGLNLPMLGFVAQDVRVGEAVRAQKPLVLAHPDCAAARSMGDLATALITSAGLRPLSAVQRGRGFTLSHESRGFRSLVRRLLGLPSGTKSAERPN